MMAVIYSSVAAVMMLVNVLAVADEGQSECPPWHYTEINDTDICSHCELPDYSDIICNERGAFIYMNTIMTATNGSYPLMMSRVIIGLCRTMGSMANSDIYRALPSNASSLQDFFCGYINREGYLCSQCKSGCGIAIYRNFGLPCECPCHGYGLPLFLLLEFGFSTLFFLLLLAVNFSANSSRWMVMILFFQLHAYIIENDPRLYTILSQQHPWIPDILLAIYGLWNMDFFRMLIPPFCVSETASILHAITSRYISAFWPLVLMIAVPFVERLHQRNCKTVVYIWKILNLVSCGLIRKRLSGINPIHVFATFFYLSHVKTLNVSLTLITALEVYSVDSKHVISTNTCSFDPRTPYLSRDHLIYALPALVILILNGLILPLVIIFYPTRWGTVIGRCIKCKRFKNASKTFIEAINGSYKDGLSGSSDYRTVSGITFFLKAIILITSVFRWYGYHYSSAEPYVILSIGLLLMAYAAFSGLFRPYKIERHSLYDILLCCIASLQSFLYLSMLLVSHYGNNSVNIFVFLSFLPVLVVLWSILWPTFVTLQNYLVKSIIIFLLSHYPV